MNQSSLPLISIITVVYNGVKTIEQTIQSVLNQTYVNIEYIIIDGGSSDGTIEIVKKHQDRLSYWVSERDNGIYDAMNKGIKQAKGDFIGIINSDDWYELDAVETIVNKIKTNKNASVIYGLLRYFKNDSFYCIMGTSSEYLCSGMIEHSTCFVKKEVYKTYGNFKTNYRILADYEFMSRIKAINLEFLLLEKVISNFRMSGISNTNYYLRYKEFYTIQYLNGCISKKKYLIQNIKLYIKSFIIWMQL